MARKGRELELVVAAVERALIPGNTNHKMESPGFLPDGEDGEPREFDVLIRFEIGRHVVHTGIEVRDRERPVGVPDIEAFATKCADCKIDRRVFVSSSGFTSTVRAKAKKHNIECLDLAKVEAFPWMPAEAFRKHDRRPKRYYVTNAIMADVAAAKADVRRKGLSESDIFNIVDADGKPADMNPMLNAAWTFAQDHFFENVTPGPDQQVALKFPLLGFHLFADIGGTPHRLILIDVAFQFDVHDEDIPYERLVYRSADGSQVLSEALICTFEAQGQKFQFTFSGKPGGQKWGEITPIEPGGRKAKTKRRTKKKDRQKRARPSPT